jgi:hypothetical protein
LVIDYVILCAERKRDDVEIFWKPRGGLIGA